MRSALTRFLGRLSVGRKQLLIFLLDMSAVVYISGILVDEKYLAIDFARKELAGNAYIDSLQRGLLASAAPRSCMRLPMQRRPCCWSARPSRPMATACRRGHVPGQGHGP